VPVPGFFSFSLSDSPDEIAKRVNFPCVVKPLRLAASQGVIRANNAEEFRAAVARTRALIESPEVQVTREPELDRLLVEDYVPGAEVAVEGLIDRGHLRILAIFDKPDPLEGPFFEETIYVTPSRLPAAAQEELSACARRTATALGLSHGPIHAEFRWNDKGPWVIECAPRPIGGLCARALRFSGGVSLEELILRHALGEDVSSHRLDGPASGVMMIPIPRAGVYEDVAGIENARAVQGIEDVVISAERGQKLGQLPEGSSYLGFLFARASAPAEVEGALRSAHALLEFKIATALPVVRGAQ